MTAAGPELVAVLAGRMPGPAEETEAIAAGPAVALARQRSRHVGDAFTVIGDRRGDECQLRVTAPAGHDATTAQTRLAAEQKGHECDA